MSNFEMNGGTGYLWHSIADKNWRIGFFYSFLSAFLWATVYISSRYLMSGEQVRIDPVTLSLLRFSIGGILLFGLCLLTCRHTMFAFSRRDFIKIALLSQFSLVGMSIFLFWGQRYTTAINSSMIMSGSPVLTMLMGVVIGERISLKQGLGMALSTLGCLLVIEVISRHGVGYSATGIKGDLLVLLAALSWAIAAVMTKKIVKPGNDLAVTGWSMLFASASLVIINCGRGNSITMPSSGSVWALVLYLAIFPTALGFYAWNAALSRISLTVVNIMQYLTPIMTVLLAYLLLQEPMGWLKGMGVGLVLGGVMLSTVSPPSPGHRKS